MGVRKAADQKLVINHRRDFQPVVKRPKAARLARKDTFVRVADLGEKGRTERTKRAKPPHITTRKAMPANVKKALKLILIDLARTAKFGRTAKIRAAALAVIKLIPAYAKVLANPTSTNTKSVRDARGILAMYGNPNITAKEKERKILHLLYIYKWYFKKSTIYSWPYKNRPLGAGNPRDAIIQTAVFLVLASQWGIKLFTQGRYYKRGPYGSKFGTFAAVENIAKRNRVNPPAQLTILILGERIAKYIVADVKDRRAIIRAAKKIKGLLTKRVRRWQRSRSFKRRETRHCKEAANRCVTVKVRSDLSIPVRRNSTLGKLMLKMGMIKKPPPPLPRTR